jgi:hypothetical protein
MLKPDNPMMVLVAYYDLDECGRPRPNTEHYDVVGVVETARDGRPAADVVIVIDGRVVVGLDEARSLGFWPENVVLEVLQARPLAQYFHEEARGHLDAMLEDAPKPGDDEEGANRPFDHRWN